MVALASILAIAVALLGVIFVWKWAGLIVEPARDQVTWWERMPGGVVGFSAIALLVFLSGLCCSLLVRRPLVAACVGAGLACVLIYPANLASALARDNHYAITEQEAAPFWNYALLATAAVMAVVDFRLGRQWLAGRPLEGRWRRRLAVHGAATLPPFFRRATIHPSTIAAFGRLAWQDLRQSWRMMGTFVGVATVICIGIGRMGDPVEVRAQLVSLVTFSTMAIIGAATFLPDQERSHFRFFAERPVRPRMVWLNRQIVWFPLVLIYLVVGVTVWVLAVVGSVYPLLERFTQPNFHVWVAPISFSAGLFAMPRICVILVAAILAYSCGQLCSMLFRGGIVAGFLSLVLAATVIAWSGLMGAMSVNWLMSVGSLAVLLLWVTWLRAPHWIAERSGWWPLTRLALSLVVPLAAIGASTIAFRVLQIPLVDPGVSLAHYASEVTPEASETAQMYRRAEGLIRMSAYPDRGSKSMTGRADHLAAQLAGVLPRYGGAAIYGAPIDSDTRKEWDERRAIAHDLKMLPWLAENQEPFRLALAATERPSCVFPLEPRGVYLWYCEQLIGTEAHCLGLAGDLDGMFACELALLRMSVHLRNHQFASGGYEIEAKTLEVLCYWWATRPGQTPERLRRAVATLDEWQRTVPPPTDSVEAGYVWLRRLFDFDPDALAAEAARDKYFAKTIDRLVSLSTFMPWEMARARRAVGVLTDLQMHFARAIVENVADGKPTSRLTHQEYSPRRIEIEQSTPLLAMFPLYNQSQFNWLEGELRRSTARILLALEAYRLEHGDLPETLEKLAGVYLPKLPRDPYSGVDFRYFPHGLPERREMFFWTHEYVTPPQLWSCGSRLTPVEMGNRTDQEYAEITWDGAMAATSSSFANMMNHGEFIRIPQPSDGAPKGALLAPEPNASGAAVEPPPRPETPAREPETHASAPQEQSPPSEPPDDNAPPDEDILSDPL